MILSQIDTTIDYAVDGHICVELASIYNALVDDSRPVQGDYRQQLATRLRHALQSFVPAGEET